ncbi:MAG: hypothetical protein SPJ77_08520, partial [Eubacteriales bacterium]|nr:hypothetical protein [Eubacteriales bacterium]
MRKIGRANAEITKKRFFIREMLKTGRGEHRSSADCQWQPLLYYLTDLFHVDYLPEQTIVRHDFVLLILFS